MLTETEREGLLAGYATMVAQDIVECAEDFEADLGFLPDDEDFLAWLLRTQHITDWRGIPLNKTTDEELLQMYYDRFGHYVEEAMEEQLLDEKVTTLPESDQLFGRVVFSRIFP